MVLLASLAGSFLLLLLGTHCCHLSLCSSVEALGHLHSHGFTCCPYTRFSNVTSTSLIPAEHATGQSNSLADGPRETKPWPPPTPPPGAPAQSPGIHLLLSQTPGIVLSSPLIPNKTCLQNHRNRPLSNQVPAPSSHFCPVTISPSFLPPSGGTLHGGQ